MRKPSVGDTLIAVSVGNMARWGDTRPREVVVTKVGRKYFEIEELRTTFFVATWKHDYPIGCVDWRLYESMQTYLDEKELNETYKKVRNRFVELYTILNTRANETY